MAFGDFKDAAGTSGGSLGASNALTMGGVTVNVDDLVYAVVAEIGGLTTTGVTDNRGNTYTALNAGTTSGTINGRAFYSRVTNAGTLSTITFAAVAGSNDFVLLAVVLEGPFGALDKNPANTADSVTSFSCPPTGLLAQADEAVIGWGVANYATAWLASSPMTLRVEELAFGKKGIIASKVVAATTTTTPVFTAASNPTAAIEGTSTFRKGVLPEIITVTNATVTLIGKTVTVLDLELVSVTQASVTLTGQTVIVRELVPVAQAAMTAAGQAVTIADLIVEVVPVDAAAVLFDGQTVDLVDITGGALDLDFINDPSIASKVTCVRADTANKDDYAGTWSAVAANTLRISDKGLLVESSRTNSLRNNSMQGAVVGTPGTIPTNWTIATPFGNLVREIVGLGTENGIDYIDIRYSGTTNAVAAGSPFAYFESATQIVASSGQTWSASVFAYIVGGSLANISSLRLGLSEHNSGGGALASSPAVITATSGPLGRRRVSIARTLNQATVARVDARLEISFASGVAIDFTIRVGWPQLENGTVVTSPIRTTTVAVTRAADVITVNSPPAINATAGGLFAEYVIPYEALTTLDYYIFQLDDGTTTNRILLFENSLLDQNIGAVRSGGSTSVANLGPGNTYTYGTVTRSAMRYAVNDAALANNGLGPAFDTTVTLPIGMNRFGIGSSATGVVNTFAYIRHLKYFDVPPSDTELVDMTTAPVELVGVDKAELELIGQTVTPTDIIVVDKAAAVLAGQAVTFSETIAVAPAAAVFIGKTVTIADFQTVIYVDKALFALAGKPLSIVDSLLVNKATVTFAGRTVTLVNSTFEDIPKYIIRGRGSRHELWTQGFGGTIKGRGSRAFLVMR